MAEFISDDARSAVVAKTEEVVAGFGGVELVETKFFKEYGNFTFEIFIWRKGGVDLNLCEAVHERLSEALDSLDSLFDGAYVLKVSSMGLDRPIVTDDDFRRALGEEIEFKAADGKKHHGVLSAYDAETVYLATEHGKDAEFDRKFITKVQPYIRF